MTPEEKQQFEELKREVEELKKYVEQKKVQQLSYPLDPVSTTIIQNL